MKLVSQNCCRGMGRGGGGRGGSRTLLRYRNDRVGWLMPMTPALERLRQVDRQKFKASLSYRVQTMSQKPQLNKEGLIIPQVQYV